MQLVTIQGQEFVKISKARAEAELLSSTTQKYHIRRIREQLHFDHIILPRLVQNCREEAPQAYSFSSRKRGAQGRYAASPVILDTSQESHVGIVSLDTEGIS